MPETPGPDPRLGPLVDDLALELRGAEQQLKVVFPGLRACVAALRQVAQKEA